VLKVTVGRVGFQHARAYASPRSEVEPLSNGQWAAERRSQWQCLNNEEAGFFAQG